MFKTCCSLLFKNIQNWSLKSFHWVSIENLISIVIFTYSVLIGLRCIYKTCKQAWTFPSAAANMMRYAQTVCFCPSRYFRFFQTPFPCSVICVSSHTSVFTDPLLDAHRSCAGLTVQTWPLPNLFLSAHVLTLALCLAFESVVAPSGRPRSVTFPFGECERSPSRPPANKSPSHGMN